MVRYQSLLKNRPVKVFEDLVACMLINKSQYCATISNIQLPWVRRVLNVLVEDHHSYSVPQMWTGSGKTTFPKTVMALRVIADQYAPSGISSHYFAKLYATTCSAVPFSLNPRKSVDAGLLLVQRHRSIIDIDVDYTRVINDDRWCVTASNAVTDVPWRTVTARAVTALFSVRRTSDNDGVAVTIRRRSAATTSTTQQLPPTTKFQISSTNALYQEAEHYAVRQALTAVTHPLLNNEHQSVKYSNENVFHIVTSPHVNQFHYGLEGVNQSQSMNVTDNVSLVIKMAIVKRTCCTIYTRRPQK